MDEAVAALSAAIPDAQPRVLIDRLVSERCDRAADARRLRSAALQCRPCGGVFRGDQTALQDEARQPRRLNNYLAALMKIEGYPRGFEGYLVAFATCYRAYKRDFSLAEMQFPWETVAEPPAAAEMKLEAAE